eukprot:532522_1
MVYLATNGPSIINTVFSASHFWCLLLLLMVIIDTTNISDGIKYDGFKTSCGYTKIGYDARKIQSDYAYIGSAFVEVKMDTEIGYDNVNVGFSYTGIEFGCITFTLFNYKIMRENKIMVINLNFFYLIWFFFI